MINKMEKFSNFKDLYFKLYIYIKLYCILNYSKNCSNSSSYDIY